MLNFEIDISKFFGRHWVDDNEAVNCHSCGKEFTLTIRKVILAVKLRVKVSFQHHCRHCGMIFCNECSTKRAKMSAAKNPQRVCDNCYIEINAR